MSVATFPPASLETQLNELRRERKLRAGVYPHWVQGGKLRQSTADFQCNALDGAIATLARLVAAQERGEPGRAELIAALRECVSIMENGDRPEVWSAAVRRANDLLAKVPA